MYEFTAWRGFDFTARQAKIERALNRAEITSPDDVPIVVIAPGYTAFGSERMPEDYFTNPASMVEHQARGCERHLALVKDDYVPYFVPWFGTGVLASGFGCQIEIPPGSGNDPVAAGPCVTSSTDAARLRMPDPYRDGWMPRVLEAIDYARTYSDLPPGLTDMQGPLDTLGLMCGQAQLYRWMYQEPQMVHDLFDMVTEAFIEWVKVQKEHISEPLDQSNGLQGLWAPSGLGVWESDDDLVLLDPGLYRDFVVTYISRIFEAFGGGFVHFCGGGYHQLENLMQIQSLRAVGNSPMGDFEEFAAFKRQLGGRIALLVQDFSPVDVEGYFTHLFAEIDNFEGVIVAPSVIDTLGMDEEGGYALVDWDCSETANRIVAITRECVRKKLDGEPILPQPAAPVFSIVETVEAERGVRSDRFTQQETVLEAVGDRLVAFDAKGIKVAVRAALEAGLTPLDIVTLGMAEGMAEVGRRYEEGEFFLPQLVMAGTTMQDGMSILRPFLQGEAGSENKGKIVLGTVQGDLHDIGKNIVKVMLEAAGFVVHDIGVDQPAANFVSAVREHSADIVAMSALLTTTVLNMAQVIDLLQEAGLRDRVRVIVGGAPVSREFANQIGAEGYAPDAIKAVREAERLMEL
jgi:5-methyltetrahydrofolate--homocysteine methyltransferase